MLAAKESSVANLDTRARTLKEQGDTLFSNRSRLVNYWQAVAMNFYPQRADFLADATDPNLSEHLFSSYPVLARREVGNLFSAMLRPRSPGGPRWFSNHVEDKKLDESPKERAFLQYLTEVQWRATYDPAANFSRATKEVDHDYVTFGNAVIEPRLDYANAHLLVRCHHIRDTAWSENASGKIDVVHRNWKPTARQLEQLFPAKISQPVKDALKTNPEQTFNCRHIIVPERLYKYDGKKIGKPKNYTSLYIDCDNEEVLEEVPQKRFGYVIPRWQTVSGSQYARSPFTEIALPDARTLQAVVRTLREAAEKHVDPPMLAAADALRSDIFLGAGGITFYDAEYDEKTGEVLRPVDSSPGTMPVGHEIALALREDIRNGAFLDKINLPQADLSKMTAFAVRRLLEEQIRAQAPLFEPIEPEYSASLCNEIFALLKDGGAFGPPSDWPKTLLDASMNFTFQSPLRDIADSTKTQQFIENIQLVAQARELDPASSAVYKITKGLEAAIRGNGTDAEFLGDEQDVEDLRKQLAEQAKLSAGMAAMGGAAEVAGKAAGAANEMAQAGM